MQARKRIMLAIAAVGVVAAAATTYVATRAPSTPPIPGGVARLEQWDVNDTRQWVLIRGRSPELPLLLVVAGGPGGSEIPAYRKHQSALERDFVVAHWEQPGSGKSYDARDGGLTLDRYLSDLRAVATRLRKEFPARPLHVIGHSWGGLLVLLSASREPALYSSVTAVSPLIAPKLNARRLYARVLDHAREIGDRSVAERLNAWGPPPHSTEDWLQRYAFLVDQERQYFSPESPADISAWDLLSVPEYSALDRVRYYQGLIRTFESVWPNVLEVDLRRDATQVVVPVFFFSGARDYNVDPTLLREYAARLKAPRKEIVNFSAAGHWPHVHEPEFFRRSLLSRLPRTSTKSQ